MNALPKAPSHRSAPALLLAAFAVATFGSGCAAEDDDASSAASQEVVEAKSPFDTVTAAFDLSVDSFATPADAKACSATWTFQQEFFSAIPGFASAPAKATFDGGRARLSGTVSLPRYASRLDAELEILCKRGDALIKAIYGLAITGLDDYEVGRSSPARIAVEKQEYSGFDGKSPVLALTVRPSSIAPSEKANSSNCKELEETSPAGVSKFYVRTRTSVAKDSLLQAPYGDDWEAKLELDRGKLTVAYEPKLAQPKSAIAVYCRPVSETGPLHVKLGVKENDAFFDDVYQPIEGDFARGTVRRTLQQPKNDSESKRSIETTIEVF